MEKVITQHYCSTEAISATWAFILFLCCYCYSVAESSPAICDPTDCSTLGSSVFHGLLEFAQIHVESVMLSIHLTLCHPLLLLP